ncbi:MAG: hypothetical protein EXR29_13020 [Betaproteobacteria bacterium]|nr:hypothetical protein [Betaproteobacteria bacterium]
MLQLPPEAASIQATLAHPVRKTGFAVLANTKWDHPILNSRGACFGQAIWPAFILDRFASIRFVIHVIRGAPMSEKELTASLPNNGPE